LVRPIEGRGKIAIPVAVAEDGYDQRNRRDAPAPRFMGHDCLDLIPRQRNHTARCGGPGQAEGKNDGASGVDED